MSSHAFVKDGNYFLLKRDEYESIERFNERGWFIASIAPKSQTELTEAIRLSRIWINMKFSKCTYDQVLVDRINKLIKSSSTI
jgi:hypothetical protein